MTELPLLLFRMILSMDGEWIWNLDIVHRWDFLRYLWIKFSPIDFFFPSFDLFYMRPMINGTVTRFSGNDDFFISSLPLSWMNWVLFFSDNKLSFFKKNYFVLAHYSCFLVVLNHFMQNLERPYFAFCIVREFLGSKNYKKWVKKVKKMSFMNLSCFLKETTTLNRLLIHQKAIISLCP